jgi:hypothetical protein
MHYRTAARLAIAASVLLVLSLPGLVARAQDDAPSGVVTGQVLDGSGNPIAGAQVELVDLPGVSAISANDGSYAITGVPLGDHAVVAIVTSSNMMSDVSLVTVGADNAVVIDLTMVTVVAEGSGSQAGDPTPTDTPVPAPVPSDTPAPAATSTRTSTPTPTPTATSIPLASLSGSVKSDQGLPAPSGTRVQLLDLPALQAGTSIDGSFSILGVPLGKHYVYAMDPLGKVSDTVEIPFNGKETRSFVLQAFQGGNATRFGGVVTAGGGPVRDAVVWRLGGSGRTMSDSHGRFLLIDATSSGDNSASPGSAPSQVMLVAAKGDQWGYLKLNLDGNTPSLLSIKLDQSGTPPPVPIAIAVTNKMSFKPAPDQFFVARWTNPKPDTNPNVVMLRIVTDDGKVDVTNGNSFGSCVGKCDGNAQGWIVKLPGNQSFSIQPWNDDTNSPWTTFDWEEGQVVHR